MITCNPLIGNLIGAKLSPLFGGYHKKTSLICVLVWQVAACAAFTPAPYFEEWWKFCIFASMYQILGMANVSPIGNIMTTSLNKEQKKEPLESWLCLMSSLEVYQLLQFMVSFWIDGVNIINIVQ
jgi:hypothetical protein